MTLNRLASIAVVTATIALTALISSVRPGHAANHGTLPPHVPGRGGRGSQGSTPVLCADELSIVPDSCGGPATSSAAVLELISFVRAQKRALEMNCDGSHDDGPAEFVVTVGTSAEAHSVGGSRNGHQGSKWSCDGLELLGSARPPPCTVASPPTTRWPT